MTWKKDEKKAKELLYDEFSVVSEYMLKIEDDIMFPNLLEFRIIPDAKYGKRDYPIRNTIDMSTQEYFMFKDEMKHVFLNL